MPLASSNGDFKEPTRILFYTDRTKGYEGQEIEGVDQLVEADGDFLLTFLRAMPHQTDPERMARIIHSLQNVKVVTLSEYQDNPTENSEDMEFPPYGKTDADIFAENLLEVMQFVFNHTTFDPKDEMDQAVLAAYKPLGVAPGQVYDPDKVSAIDSERFRATAEQVQRKSLAMLGDPQMVAELSPRIFQPKGQTDLEATLVVSITGPIGLPQEEAVYPQVVTVDGKVMNAMHDYVVRMDAEQLPPAGPFWSLTLYDLDQGFFIPNERKKYSVGENAGMQLNDDGGIEIYIAARKPEGVPEENWLPIQREDLDLSPQLRLYVPDLEKMKVWQPPKAEKLEN